MRKQAGVALKKVVLWGLGVVVLLVGGAAAFYGPTILDLSRAGFFEKQKKRQWTPETEKNLQALQTALKLVHESDGAYPKADQWMDKIKNRVRTEDLSKEDANKKFVDPAAGGGFGFAFNDEAADKYIDDLPKKGETILIFQSTETAWNAHGDPAKIGRAGGLGITADGKIVPLQANGT